MRKHTLLFIILLYASHCFAQDTKETIEQKNRLTQSVIENYNVLKADKSIKQGRYRAMYGRKIALAMGNYANNQRVGIWHFYDTHETLVENFDYDNTKLLYEEPMDSLSQTKIVYAFDKKITDSDYVTKPIKIGGRCFGYIPYLKVYMLSDDLYGINIYTAVVVMELLVSPGGRLADFKVHIRSNGYERITTFSPELIDEDDRSFIPATFNHQPVLSRVFVKCRIADDGTLDVD